MSKNGKKRSFGGLLLDFVLVLCTGGLWLIWILIVILETTVNLNIHTLTEMLKRVSRSFFFMLFMPREKNMAFYEERSKRANF